MPAEHTLEADLQKAAKHIGEHLKIPGFRAGQAPYDIVSRQIGGEAKIYEEALQAIVSRTLPKIIIEGELEKMLDRVADNYDRQVDNTIGALTSLLEPLMIVVMAAMVAFIVLSVMLPMLQLSDIKRR